MRREIRETCDRIVKDISERLYESIISGKMPNSEELLNQQDIVDIKRRVFAIQVRLAIRRCPAYAARATAVWACCRPW